MVFVGHVANFSHRSTTFYNLQNFHDQHLQITNSPCPPLPSPRAALPSQQKPQSLPPLFCPPPRNAKKPPSLTTSNSTSRSQTKQHPKHPPRKNERAFTTAPIPSVKNHTTDPVTWKRTSAATPANAPSPAPTPTVPQPSCAKPTSPPTFPASTLPPPPENMSAPIPAAGRASLQRST